MLPSVRNSYHNWHAMADRFISNEGLVELLSRASADERLALTRTLAPSASIAWSPKSLQTEASTAGGHGVANFFRGGGTGYIDIVDDIIDELKIPDIPKYDGLFKEGILVHELDKFSTVRSTPEAQARQAQRGRRTKPFTEAEIPHLIQLGHEYCELAEQKILLKVLQVTYDKLDPQQRAKFDAEVAKVAAQFGKNDPTGKLAGAAGLMAIANLGGFATYMLMSSVLSTLSLGMLGFGAYTAASSALSVILGPVGWLALGATTAYTLGKAELKKTIPFVVTAAMIRQRVISS